MLKRVLCIEDDSVTQFLNKIELEDAGFCEIMDEAWNGQVALDYFENIAKEEDPLSKVPDLILLDLLMPYLSGFEVMEQLKMVPRCIEIIKPIRDILFILVSF